MNKVQPPKRRWIKWLVLLGIVGALLAGLHVYKDELASRALHSVARVSEQAGHRITFGGVHVSIIHAHIRLTDLDVTPMADSTMEDSAVRYTVHAEAIDLRGVDLLALFQRKVLHVGRIELHAPSVSHSFITRTAQPAKRERPAPETTVAKAPLDLVRVDTLLIVDATGRSQDRASTHPALSIADLDLLLAGITVEQGGNGIPMPMVEHIDLKLHQAEAHIKPYYTLALDSVHIRIPQDTAVIFGLRFTPDVSPKEYHKHVEFQVELYSATVDSLMLTGFDLRAKLVDGAIRAKELLVAGVAVDIHRDKTLPLPEERKLKPLIADRVTAWRVPISVDSVHVRRGQVRYHERLEVDDDYGSLAFTDISGQLTGLSNEPVDEPADLHLVGSARVGRAQAQLDLRMPMQRDHTTVTTRVLLLNFPAKEMNRMTDDLLHVNATAGILHRVEMRMKGDEDRATGTLEMRYEDLHLEIAPTTKHAWVLNKVANALVRTTNMPGDKNYRTGKFTVERRKTSGIFNYIWISLRTGMMEVVLPPRLLNEMKKKQKKKG
jgi:hypothetical protein